MMRNDDSRVHPSVPVCPTDEERHRRRLWEICIQHPVDDERGIFIGRVFWTDDERTEKIASVFVGSHDNRS